MGMEPWAQLSEFAGDFSLVKYHQIVAHRHSPCFRYTVAGRMWLQTECFCFFIIPQIQGCENRQFDSEDKCCRVKSKSGFLL